VKGATVPAVPPPEAWEVSFWAEQFHIHPETIRRQIRKTLTTKDPIARHGLYRLPGGGYRLTQAWVECQFGVRRLSVPTTKKKPIEEGLVAYPSSPAGQTGSDLAGHPELNTERQGGCR